MEHFLSKTSRRSALFFSLIICSAIFLLYSVAFGHNFLFDEESIILKNPLIRDLSQVFEIFRQPYFYEGLPEISWSQYYRPLTTLSFAVDYHFWGVNPLGYNLINTLFHCGVCVLIFRLLSRMLEDERAAFLATLLYSIHTIHTEAVTYIASRGDVLGTFLMLLALSFFWKSRFGGAFLVQALALFAKESAILLPVYFVLLDISFIKSRWTVLIKKTAPSIALNIIFVIFRKQVCLVPMGPPSIDWGEGFLRVLSMGPSFLSYLEAIFFPEIFKFSITVNFAKHLMDIQVVQTVFIIVLLMIGWAAALRRRGAAFFGISIFLISFLPYSQFIHFYPEWAEHYLYLPAVGLTILLGCLLKHVLRRRNRYFLIFLIVYIPFTSFLSYRTLQRNNIYNDTQTYFEYLAKSNARYAHFGYQNLGRLAIEGGELDKAIVPLKTAESIEPRSDVTQNLLGLYYLQKGNLQEALNHFELAYKYNGVNQVYRINVSYILMRMGKYQEVVDVLEKVQKIVPEYSSVYINLLAANELLGNVDAARQWGEMGLEKTKKNEWEHVTLLMAVARLAYRQGWEDRSRAVFEEIADKHSKVFWYSDIARLIIGKITAEEFLGLMKIRYFGFENSAQSYVLMSYVLQKQWEKVENFLTEKKESLEKQAAKQPLLKKEIDRAREGVNRYKPIGRVEKS